MYRDYLSGWGKNIFVESNVFKPQNVGEIKKFFKKNKTLTLRGLGRSYGDSSLGESVAITTNMNRLISFDENTGILECESGTSLSEIIKIFVPRGWFIPVTPGTRFVTIGGMLASDVHGKNHHLSGSFSSHVIGFSLLTANGKILWIDRKKYLEIFLATAGGMGLTGSIITVRFKMIPIKSSWIKQKIHKIKSLDRLLEKLEETKRTTYSVAWVDCFAKGKELGRSLLFLGEHAMTNEIHNYEQKKPLSLEIKNRYKIHFNFPEFIMNRWIIKTFNTFYYNHINGDYNYSVVPLIKFFYPLDSILEWNRIYGKKGFFQYQCVLPKKPCGAEKLRELLQTISRSDEGSFLAVIKLFGEDDDPYLSFAKEGYTLSLDFPIRPKTSSLLKKLDSIVIEAKGRLYLAKDSRMSADFFKSTYPDYKKFLIVKRSLDPKNYFTSKQAYRLGII